MLLIIERLESTAPLPVPPVKGNTFWTRLVLLPHVLGGPPVENVGEQIALFGLLEFVLSPG